MFSKKARSRAPKAVSSKRLLDRALRCNMALIMRPFDAGLPPALGFILDPQKTIRVCACSLPLHPIIMTPDLAEKGKIIGRDRDLR